MIRTGVAWSRHSAPLCAAPSSVSSQKVVCRRSHRPFGRASALCPLGTLNQSNISCPGMNQESDGTDSNRCWMPPNLRHRTSFYCVSKQQSSDFSGVFWEYRLGPLLPLHRSFLGTFFTRRCDSSMCCCDRPASDFCAYTAVTRPWVASPDSRSPQICFVFIRGRIIQKLKTKQSRHVHSWGFFKSVSVSVTAGLLQQPDNIIASLFLLGNKRKSILVLLIHRCGGDLRPDCTPQK